MMVPLPVEEAELATGGGRDMLSLSVREGSAVTLIFPLDMEVLKECSALGAGASSVPSNEMVNKERHKISYQCRPCKH